MTALQRVQLLGSLVGRGLWLVASRHYLSIVSAGVLAVLAVLVLTSDSFESRDPGPGDGSTVQRNEAGPAVPAQPRPRRPMVLFYVVNDTAQRDELAAALDADRFAYAGDTPPPEYVFYLIAGTREEESAAIDRLNFEELLARQSNVDMRVIDLRGRFD